MSKSNRIIVLSGEATVTPSAGQSSGVALTQKPKSQDMRDMSDITVKVQNPTDSPHTMRLFHANAISALAAKLGALVFWRELALKDGTHVYALCFPFAHWERDPETKTLKPKGAK